MKDILVSVIMPVYNAQKYLDKAIRSILAQTHRNLEFIIVDDASTDDSWKILKEHAQNDDRIKIYRNSKNQKIVKTRNKGFSYMNPDTKYVAIMDSDDIAIPERLEKQILFLEENKDYGLVGSHNIIIDEKDIIIGYRRYPLTDRQIRKVIARFDPISQPTALIRASVLEKVGLYNEKYTRCQDYDLWFRIADKYKIGNIDEFLLKYRISKTQGKATHLVDTIKFTIDIQKKWLFDKRYFGIKNYLFFLAEHLAIIFPKTTLKLFKKMRYKRKSK